MPQCTLKACGRYCSVMLLPLNSYSMDCSSDCPSGFSQIWGNRNASQFAMSSDFRIGPRNSFPVECRGAHRNGNHGVSSWRVALKTERDTHDIKALRLISDPVADEIQRLSDKLNLSVVEVLAQGARLLDGSGLEKHRKSIRAYWETLPPEERKARASRASRARWDAEKAKQGQS